MRRGFQSQHFKGLSLLFYLCFIGFIAVMVVNIHNTKEVIFFTCAAIFSLLIGLLCSFLAVRNAK